MGSSPLWVRAGWEKCTARDTRLERIVAVKILPPTFSADAERLRRFGQEARAAQVVEFCYAWIKCKLGLRQFHVPGKIKARAQALWACLTYNLQQWIRLRKITALPVAA